MWATWRTRFADPFDRQDGAAGLTWRRVDMAEDHRGEATAGQAAFDGIADRVEPDQCLEPIVRKAGIEV